MADPDVERTSTPHPASVTVNLHTDPRHVRAIDLTDRAGVDLVDLRLGCDWAGVSILGTLDHLLAIVAAAQRQLDDVAEARDVPSAAQRAETGDR